MTTQELIAELDKTRMSVDMGYELGSALGFLVASVGREKAKELVSALIDVCIPQWIGDLKQ